MKRLYQWLHDRAIALRTEAVDWNRHRTVRTEVTVQEQTLLLAGLPLSGDCPLCGQALGAGGLHGVIAQGFPSHSGCASPHIEAEILPANQTPHAKKELP